MNGETWSNDAAPPDDGVGLLRRLRRRKGWFILGSAALLSAVVAIVAVLPRSYRATAQVVVAGNEPLVAGTAQNDALRLGDPADLESQVLMLRSPQLLDRILDDPRVYDALVRDCIASRAGWMAASLARLGEGASCEGLAGSRARAITRLDAGLSVAPVGRSRVIEVAFTSRLPEVGAAVANALVDAYLADDKARKVGTRVAATDWLRGEVARAGDELRRAEVAAERYRREHGLVRGQLASISSERLSSQAQELAAAQAAYATAGARLQQFSGNPGELREGLDNRIVADLKQQLAEVSAKRAQISARLGAQHPDAAELVQRQQDLQSRLNQEYRSLAAGLTRDRDAARSRVAELTAGLEGLKRGVGDAAGAEAEMATLARDVDVKRELFVQLSRKVSELEVERRLVPGDARLVHHASVPQRPWFPKPVPFLAAGGGLAVAFGAALALLRDRADRTVRADTGLARLSGVPVIGRIPKATSRDRLPGAAGARAGRVSPLQDAIRALFARCVLLRDPAPRVLLVTSSASGEGKTFLALGLAQFAASTGRRVLAVECDLRRPSFAGALGLPDGPGLTDYLRGEAGFDEVLARPVRGAFDAVAAGRPTPDSTELLGAGRFGALLQAAKPRYDLILLDTPPSQMLVDAKLLARQADGIIYCVSWGRSRIEGVLDGIGGLQEAGGRVLGLAIGMVKPREYPLYEPRAPLASPGRAA